MLTEHRTLSLDALDTNIIQQNVPLADKNWFRTGGPARFFAQPKTNKEFQYCLQFVLSHTLPIFLLGNGANILISDDGFDGLVIRPQLIDKTIKELTPEYSLVTAGAGLSLDELIEFCLQNNLGGLEEFSGIPGTVGGAVFINLHYF